MTEEESMDQFVWNDLWQIMKRAKVDSLCCLGYPDRVRKCKRFLTLCVVVILILGCLVYFIKPEYTLYGSIVSAIIEILKEYTPAFIPKEDNLKAIEKLAPRFEKILADAEEIKVKYSIRTEGVSNMDVQKKCSDFKVSLSKEEAKMNPLVRHIWFFENNKYNREAEKYLRSKYQ